MVTDRETWARFIDMVDPRAVFPLSMARDSRYFYVCIVSLHWIDCLTDGLTESPTHTYTHIHTHPGTPNQIVDFSRVCGSYVSSRWCAFRIGIVFGLWSTSTRILTNQPKPRYLQFQVIACQSYAYCCCAFQIPFRQVARASHRIQSVECFFFAR